MDNRIVLYKSRKKAAALVLLSLLLILGGWLLLRSTDKDVIGWSFMILAALCLLLGIGTLTDRKPVIILTPSGITDLSGIRQEIEWNAIRRVDESYYRGQYFIRLLLDRGYKPELVRPTWFYRFDRLYEREGVKAVFIRTGLLEVKPFKLFRFIERMIQCDPAKRMELLKKRPAEW